MRSSLTFRAIVVGILALLLLIPLGMVNDLIRERSYRKQEAEEGISRDWGGEQTILGPIIDVPYEVPVRVPVGDGSGRMEDRVEIHHAQFLPESLNANVVLDPYKKHRGIYDVAVYGSRTHITGSFAPISDARLNIGYKMRWNDAELVIGISDLRSIKEQVSMVIGDDTVQFEPGLPSNDVASTGLSVPFPLDSLLGVPINFIAKLTINGSGSYNLVPVGKVTKAHCTSSWKDPSYHGAFLPDPVDSVAKPGDGLNANWTVLHLNRPYPQEFTGNRQAQIEGSAFGVRLMQPVDEYQKNERASKYGVMLIVMVFLVFFFVEVLQALRIHPIQYLLVGFALCIFYTLLIAISEHLGFAKAYILSAIAVIGLVVLYAHSVFNVKRASQLLGLIMLLVFGFMFALINEQDYALLFGSIGLFITLALVMWVSRKIDWNGEKAVE
ncbi:MAG: cell envelope integrity protein CreD [Flavobacteriales bacterium]|nr:cell envelope integrity protein CreD [Flavobacteriales bacterium]MBK6945229.1 cell envelope integrity protein CreD [Flavobacteriales bacterium]MBK7239578.1 cell envelope integrity protein CreD [Flavobacteriales bacterium]MBK9535215.1 cell envelope integrity protein CreD [Flavobacteriales bacterium]MBP9137809.1 cell envelope integrity protein CreD [Flavobacteriales bacterium]